MHKMNTENTKGTLLVTELQRFCMHDGPGIRTTVFLKGCPLRCAWCHNPETQETGAEFLYYSDRCIGCMACAKVCPRGVHTGTDTHEIDRDKCIACFACAEACPPRAIEQCGREMTAEEILHEVERDRAFYGKTGGVTLSGGEPLLQAQSVHLLSLCKENGLHTALETCGMVSREVLHSALPYTDLFLWDLKDTDSARHRQYTGAPNEKILENLREINRRGARIRLRCILVQGVNTDRAHYRRVAEIASELSSGNGNFEGVEWIPYHAYGGTKAVFLGRSDNGHREWIPSAESLAEAKETLSAYGVRVI